MAHDDNDKRHVVFAPTEKAPLDSRPGDAEAVGVRSRTERLVQADGWDVASLGAAREPAIAATSEGLDRGARIGQFELIRELGRGGMGAVYLARDTHLGRRVAMKFLAHDDPALAARFLSEARVTARCKHENIVDIYEADEAQGHSFMVLEYIEGRTLRAWLEERWREDGRISIAEVVAVAVPIVRALVHAHRRGLVHRDLKPENVMLTDGGTIKVLDFGIAKILGPRELPEMPDRSHWTGPVEDGLGTGTGLLIGTLPYMSPEQLRGGDVDARSDIWAMGIILWELALGRHPLAPVTRAQLESVRDLQFPMPSMAAANPDLAALAAIVDRCLEKSSTSRIPTAGALLAALESLAAATPSDAGHRGQVAKSPYLGLAAFQRTDADLFFGRERDVTLLIERLRQHRMVTVAGASGAGKSSLVRAGVIPTLARSGQPWESFVLRPGRRPLAALADILARLEPMPGEASSTEVSRSAADRSRADATDRQRLLDTLRTQPGYPATLLRARSRRRGSRILVFVDQFEELYTLGTDRDTRAAFVDCLEAVADDASSPLRVIVSVRADFLDRVAEDRAFTSELTRALILLSPLSRSQLRAALTRPLAATGDYTFESESLIEAMLDSLSATRSPLPLLQFTAAQLWAARDAARKLITQDSYRALGGVEGALATHADAVLDQLSRGERQLARGVLTSLVSEERTRAIVSVAELVSSLGTGRGQDLERVLAHLAGSRLVLMESERDAGATVELIHESLIDRWTTLIRWLDEDQDATAFRGRLRAAARQWDQQGRSEDLLWRGQAAREAGRWRDDVDAALPDLGVRDRAYLDAVVGLAARRARRRWRLLVGTIVVLGAIAIAVTFLAFQARRSATAERESADRARRSAIHARNATRMAAASEHRSDPTLTLALVRELEPTAQPPPGWRELARWASRQRVSPVVLTHPDPVAAAAFSPDGRYIVTACADGRARVWPADGIGQPMVLEGHGDKVRAAAFSPDSERVVTGSSDRTARVWMVRDRVEIARLEGHRRGVFAVAFSPDGQRIVTGSVDATARVWNADGSGQPVHLEGHRRDIWSVAFSPDGLRVVTGSRDSTARIWNADGSGEPIELLGHRSPVRSVAFSPDGRRVVTGSWDDTARVWNADGSGQPVRLEGHLQSVFSAAFSPDGTRIVTGSSDRTARVWNADGSGRSVRIDGHQDGLVSAAFGPAGRRIVTASTDRTARVWNVAGDDASVRLEGHEDQVRAAAFSPDGQRIATASWDGTARVWNAATGEQLVRLEGPPKAVSNVAFSPDGQYIVMVAEHPVALVWRADGSGRPVRLEGHTELLRAAVFSPDGRRIATASADHTARVWNADGSGESVRLEGHSGSVVSVAFSPDGRRTVTASSDGTARVWNADGSGEPVRLEGHRDQVLAAAFSPDGRLIVTASMDKTARVWSADDRVERARLQGHESIVMTAAFSPDGTRIATASLDQTLRIWNVEQAMAGVSLPATLRMPYLRAATVAFSPDGRRIATAGHTKADPGTGSIQYWATVWPTFERLQGPEDRELWTATTYCPPIEARLAILGMSRDLAEAQFARCRSRVLAAPR